VIPLKLDTLATSAALGRISEGGMLLGRAGRRSASVVLGQIADALVAYILLAGEDQSKSAGALLGRSRRPAII